MSDLVKDWKAGLAALGVRSLEDYEATGKDLAASSGEQEVSPEEVAWLEKRKKKLTGSHFGELMAGYGDPAEIEAKIENAVMIPSGVLNSDGHKRGKPYTDWKKEQTLKEGQAFATEAEIEKLQASLEASKGFTQVGITYLNRKLAEHLGSSYSFTAAALEWGKQYEPQALDLYEQRMRDSGSTLELDRTPFNFFEPGSDEELRGRIGTTPDAMLTPTACRVAYAGTVEVKCRKDPAIHMATVRSGEVPAENYWQCVGHMAIAGVNWCDFVSFDPTMDASEYQRLVVIRISRDEGEILKLLDRLRMAVEWIDVELKKLKSAAIRKRIEDLAFTPDEIVEGDRAAIASMFTVG